LDVHLGQRQVDGLVRAGTFFESRGIKLTGTHLRHLEGHFTQPGKHGLGLETIGVIAPGCGAFVRPGTEKLGSLDLGRFIDEDAQCFARAIQPVLKQRCIGRLQRVRFDSHGHVAYTPSLMSWRQTSRLTARAVRLNGIYRKKDTQLWPKAAHCARQEL